MARRGSLVEADTRHGAHLAHLAHQLGHVDVCGARVRGADSETPVVGDHLGEDVQDGLLWGV